MQRKISRYADFPQAKKDDLVAAVSSELLESDLEEEKESSSSMWVVQIDRGGHVNDHTYLLFYELLIELLDLLVKEVLFHWSLLTTCMELTVQTAQTPFYHIGFSTLD